VEETLGELKDRQEALGTGLVEILGWIMKMLGGLIGLLLVQSCMNNF
jgi:hypothetical protein